MVKTVNLSLSSASLTHLFVSHRRSFKAYRPLSTSAYSPKPSSLEQYRPRTASPSF